MRSKIIQLFFIVSLFSSCSSDDSVVNNNIIEDNQIVISDNDIFIDKKITELSLNDAEKVAFLFKNKNNKALLKTKMARQDKDIAHIQTINDSLTNKPILYIVNWGNNNGYVIISATKKNAPVLAFAETGYLDSELDLASKDYMGTYKDEIINSSKDNNDSLRVKYSFEWALFENPEANTSTRSSSMYDKIQEEINKKTSMGYTYMGKLPNLASFLPYDEYEAAKRDICMHTDTEYNCEDVSLFFIKEFNYNQTGPLINTKWHQGSPFNVDTPNGYAGCVPIAVAQITYYHKHPPKYNWSQISGRNPILTPGLKEFIVDIRNLCKVKYQNDGTSSNYKDAIEAFGKLGYTAKEVGLPDNMKLRSEIQFGRPVYIRGENDKKEGHAWVCEGYLNKRYEAVVSMILDKRFDIDGGGPVKYYDYNIRVNSGPNEPSTSEYFYMNFGWGGGNDGWYRANSYNQHDSRYNFFKDQKMITVRK